MQKFDIPFIKTGDFARLCNTNKRTLFHYDEIGLFSPAYTDEKGYRYYSESQCDVFFTITCLKDMGMPLKGIKEYVDNRNPGYLKRLLMEQQEKVLGEMERLKRIERVIRTKIELVELGQELEQNNRMEEAVLEEAQEEYLIISPEIYTSRHETVFEALCGHIGYVNHYKLNAGHPYGAMLSSRDLAAGHYDIYAHFFTKVPAKSFKHPCHVKPGGRYAAIYLKGDYYNVADAYEKLLTYMKKNRLQMGEFSYKEAVLDETAVKEKDGYITRISIPVKPS